MFQVLLTAAVSGEESVADEDVAEVSDNGVEAVFSPSVSATCRAGVMTISVETNNKFIGAVHARDYRQVSYLVYQNWKAAEIGWSCH